MAEGREDLTGSPDTIVGILPGHTQSGLPRACPANYLYLKPPLFLRSTEQELTTSLKMTANVPLGLQYRTLFTSTSNLHTLLRKPSKENHPRVKPLQQSLRFPVQPHRRGYCSSRICSPLILPLLSVWRAFKQKGAGKNRSLRVTDPRSYLTLSRAGCGGLGKLVGLPALECREAAHSGLPNFPGVRKSWALGNPLSRANLLVDHPVSFPRLQNKSMNACQLGCCENVRKFCRLPCSIRNIVLPKCQFPGFFPLCHSGFVPQTANESITFHLAQGSNSAHQALPRVRRHLVLTTIWHGK